MTSPAVARPRHHVPAPDLRLVERKGRAARAPARVQPAILLALAVVLVFSTLIAAAVVHSMLVSGQAELDVVTTQTGIEQEALLREQLELAELQSPANITREAQRMGMVPGQGDNWLAAQPAPDAGSTDVSSSTSPSDAAEVAAPAVDSGEPTP